MFSVMVMAILVFTRIKIIFRHAREVTSLQNELESMKELLHTYEQSIERKDDVITNLTRAMQKQKDKFDMLKTFCEWKIKHNDMKREVSEIFCGRIVAFIVFEDTKI